MKVICKNCRTAMEIDGNSIPPSGAQFRCMKCKSVISVGPVEGMDYVPEEEAAEEIELSPSPIKRPVAVPPAGIVDLPVPKGAKPSGAGLVDLPAPKSSKPSGAGLVDLPAPKSSKPSGAGLVDLPAPKGAKASGAGLVDLPAPKGSIGVTDLPAPKGSIGVTDLPAPKGSIGVTDLPRPKIDAAPTVAPDEELDGSDLQLDIEGEEEPPQTKQMGSPFRKSASMEMPAPPQLGGVGYGERDLGGGDSSPSVTESSAAKSDVGDGGFSWSEDFDLQAPSSSASSSESSLSNSASGAVSSGQAGGAGTRGPTMASSGAAAYQVRLDDVVGSPEEEAAFVTSAPPPREDIAESGDEVSLDFVPATERPEEAEEKVPQGTKIVSKTPREPLTTKQKIIFAAGAGGLVLVIGLCLAIFTDFGFLGLNVITGRYGKTRKAMTLLETGKKTLWNDTFAAYREAAEGFASASQNMPSSIEPGAWYVQAISAMSVRFGVDPERRNLINGIMPKLQKIDAEAPSIKRASALMKLADGQAAEAVTILKSISEKGQPNPLNTVFLGWAQMEIKDYAGAAASFNQALTAQQIMPVAIFSMVRLFERQQKNEDALAWVEKILAVAPSHPGAMLIKSKIFLAAGKKPEALGGLRKVTTLVKEAAPTELAEANALLGEVAAQDGLSDEAANYFKAALVYNPRMMSARLGQGQLMLAMRRFDDALVDFKQAQTNEPENIQPKVFIGQTLIEKGQVEEAKKIFLGLRREAPKNAAVVALLGRAELAGQKIAPAEKLFVEALKIDGKYLPAYLYLSQLYTQQNKIEQAQQILKRAEKNSPQSALVQNAQGELLLAQKKFTEAQAKFDYALKLDPRLKIALFNWAMALTGDDKLSEAKEKYLALRDIDKNFPGLSTKLAQLYLEMKEFAPAAQEYEEALKAPNPPLSLMLEAARAFVLAGQFEKALKQSEVVLKTNPALSDAQAIRAEARLAQNKLDDAMSEIQQAIGREKKNEYVVILGRIYDAMGKIDEAIESYGEAVAGNPSLINIRSRRAILLVKSGTVKDGMTELKKVIAQDPKRAEPYLYLGDAYTGLRQEKDAQAAYQQAIARDEKIAEAHYKLGQIHFDNQRWSLAIASFQQATKYVTPTDTWRIDVLFQLARAADSGKQLKLAADSYADYLRQAPANATMRSEAETRLRQLGGTVPKPQ